MRHDNVYNDSFAHRTDFNPRAYVRHDLIFKSANVYPCEVCKEKTSWVSMSFETHVCSEECLDALWKEYNDYCEGDK